MITGELEQMKAKNKTKTDDNDAQPSSTVHLTWRDSLLAVTNRLLSSNHKFYIGPDDYSACDVIAKFVMLTTEQPHQRRPKHVGLPNISWVLVSSAGASMTMIHLSVPCAIITSLSCAPHLMKLYPTPVCCESCRISLQATNLKRAQFSECAPRLGGQASI